MVVMESVMITSITVIVIEATNLQFVKVEETQTFLNLDFELTVIMFKEFLELTNFIKEIFTIIK